jgi:hypothetical protein
MAHKSPENTKSYDDIVRATVVDPDSSVRPSPAQVKAAHEGFRAVDSDEAELVHRVHAAIAASGADITAVTVEVSRDLVTLRGRVPRVEMLRQLEDAVALVPGVSSIQDQVVVGAAGSA